MKFHIKKHWMGSIRHLDTYLVIFPSHTDLPRLFLAIEQANCGCVVIWKTICHNVPNNETFQCLFWSFKPSIEGFTYCCSVLSIDGTHLDRKYKGTLLIAMGCDGNNQLFPLTFAITEGENIDSWGWFLASMRNRVTQRTGICVISDRYLGIMAVMSDPHLRWDAPYAYHRICMRYLASNFMTRFKDKLFKDNHRKQFVNYQLLLVVVTCNLYITNFKFGCFVAYIFSKYSALNSR